MSTTRAPAGAARPSERVDTAVRRAMMEELYDVGYAATSMEAVARRAGVGKAALYRRWTSKRDMYMTALHDLADDPELAPDTGTVYGDVVAYGRSLRGDLGARARKYLPELVAIGVRDEEFRQEIEQHVFDPWRQILTEVMGRGVRRGELPADTDLETVVDVLVGTAFWRYGVRWRDLTDESIDRFARAVVGAAGGVVPSA